MFDFAKEQPGAFATVRRKAAYVLKPTQAAFQITKTIRKLLITVMFYFLFT